MELRSNPSQATSTQPSQLSSPSPNQTFERLKNGETIMVSGKPYSVLVVPKEEMAFRPPSTLPAEDRENLERVLNAFEGIRDPIRRMNGRLLDPTDGKAMEFVDQLTRIVPLLPNEFAQPLRDYLTAVITNGCFIHHKRNSVILPPFPLKKLESLLTEVAPELLQDKNFTAWSTTAYRAWPLATQGYYLLSNPAAQRFLDLVSGSNPAFEAAVDDLIALGAKAVEEGGLSSEAAKTFDALSLTVIEAQRKCLLDLMKDLPNKELIEAHSTRVHISIGELGELAFKPIHFTEAFRSELDEIAQCLSNAARYVPPTAPNLFAIINELVDWAAEPSADLRWGDSGTKWLTSNDPEEVIDITVCAEEEASLIGKKGAPMLCVYQYTEMPEAGREAWKVYQDQAATKDVRAILFRTLMSAGNSFVTPIMGENLPNQPRIVNGNNIGSKSMTFANISMLLGLEANKSSISEATGLTFTELGRYYELGIPLFHVAMHEWSHTFDAPARHIDKATSVKETNAQSGAVYLTAIAAPHLLNEVGTWMACWMPIRRVRQGLAGAHSHSDVVLCDEYLKAGATKIVETANGPALQIADPEILLQTAFKMALKMRLWEVGVPSSAQDSFSASVVFDRSNPHRIVELVKAAETKVAALDPQESARWKAEANSDVNAYFAQSRLQEIVERLSVITGRMNPIQAFAVLPGDARLERLVA